MHYPIPIAQDIYWIGVNDFETDLFEALWPLPQGITYNSYIILDRKTVLIDSVKSSFLNSYIEKLRTALPEGKVVDYLIINHMEPDHSGSINALLDLFPAMQIIGNKKTGELLESFYGIKDRFIVIGDGDIIDLGIHKLRFLITPMVHWPETMMTYETSEQILFSGDVFGGFGAFSGAVFDDEVDLVFFKHEILRYFSNIIGKYSSMVQKAIDKVRKYDISLIASTHGPVFRKNPDFIIDSYYAWSKYEAHPGATIVYGSMYGNTQKMAETIARTCVEEGISVALRNVSREHVSFAISDSWQNKLLFLGSPTYNTRLFPYLDLFLRSIDDKFLQTRIIGIFGSYSWSGGAVKMLRELSQKGSWNIVDPILEAKSSPTVNDLELCVILARNAVIRMRDAGF